MILILKRLELIKVSIAIEDSDIIEVQVMKLRQLDIDEDVRLVLEKLEENDFSTALQLINTYTARYSSLTLYDDVEISSLKMELKSLEIQLQNLIEQKAEYLNALHDFNRQYNLHLGEIIRTILNLKKEIIYKKTIKQRKLKIKLEADLQTAENTQSTIEELNKSIEELKEALNNINEDYEDYNKITLAYNELMEELKRLKEEFAAQQIELENIKEVLEDDETFQEYEDAQSRYNEFDRSYEDIKKAEKNTLNLSDDEKLELKTLYRKAARLCHPDIVPNELKEKAHDLMQQLNAAYSKNDLEQVRKILFSFENGFGYDLSCDNINDKELLREKIKEYKQTIANFKIQIEEIKQDDTFAIISDIIDWNEYFKKIKQQLIEEKERLEMESATTFEDNG